MEKAHSSGIGRYVAVFVGLGIITAVEVALGAARVINLDPGLLVLVLLVMSAAKAALVAMFFMHLRDDTKWFSLIFIFPFLLSSLLIFWTVFERLG